MTKEGRVEMIKDLLKEIQEDPSKFNPTSIMDHAIGRLS
jgi:hypothetical protein